MLKIELEHKIDKLIKDYGKKTDSPTQDEIDKLSATMTCVVWKDEAYWIPDRGVNKDEAQQHHILRYDYNYFGINNLGAKVLSERKIVQIAKELVADPENVDTEYLRGICELIAHKYPEEGVDSGDRACRVAQILGIDQSVIDLMY